MRTRRFLIYAAIYAAIAYVSIAAFRLPHPPLWAMAGGLLVGLTALRIVSWIAEGLSIKSDRYQRTCGLLCLGTVLGLVTVTVYIGVRWGALSSYLFFVVAVLTWFLQLVTDPVRIIQGDLERVSFKAIKVLTVVGWVILLAGSLAFLISKDPSFGTNLTGEVLVPALMLGPTLAFFGQIFWGMTLAAREKRRFGFSPHDISSGLTLVALGTMISCLAVITVGLDPLMIGRIGAIIGTVAGVLLALHLLARPMPVRSKSDAAAIQLPRNIDPRFLDRIP